MMFLLAIGVSQVLEQGGPSGDSKWGYRPAAMVEVIRRTLEQDSHNTHSFTRKLPRCLYSDPRWEIWGYCVTASRH
jgi:hypothetical protein